MQAQNIRGGVFLYRGEEIINEFISYSCYTVMTTLLILCVYTYHRFSTAISYLIYFIHATKIQQQQKGTVQQLINIGRYVKIA